jgi:thiamine-monophosphate kinase
LIGGDTTRGPLNISITIMGQVPIGQALQRSGAQAGDDIWVSGALGSAALGLAHLQQQITLPADTMTTCLEALHQPQPRVALGLALRGVATSCIDISDGLLADLNHVLMASKLGACLQFEQLPALDYLALQRHLPQVQAAMLAGGDDYELCFTAPRAHADTIFGLAESLSLPLTRIGEVTQAPNLSVLYQQQPLPLSLLGYDHFA